MKASPFKVAKRYIKTSADVRRMGELLSSGEQDPYLIDRFAREYARNPVNEYDELVWELSTEHARFFDAPFALATKALMVKYAQKSTESLTESVNILDRGLKGGETGWVMPGRLTDAQFSMFFSRADIKRKVLGVEGITFRLSYFCSSSGPETDGESLRTRVDITAPGHPEDRRALEEIVARVYSLFRRWETERNDATASVRFEKGTSGGPEDWRKVFRELPGEMKKVVRALQN